MAAHDTQPEQKQSTTWIHAEAPSEHEIQVLCKQYSLNEQFLRDALDRDEIPRVETDDNYTYIFTRFAYETKEGNIETAPILFALNHHKLVTVSLEKLPTKDGVLPNHGDLAAKKEPVLVMLQILLQIDAAYDSFIHDSSKQIRHLLDRLGTREVGPKSFIRFVHIEDDMNDFLSSLGPTNTTLRHLLSDRHVPAFAKHRALVNTVILNNDQSIQTCETNLKSLVSIRRTYSLINSHNLDRTIKILTLASVFISIPTMFFSMYGMNIGLPQQQHKGAFAVLMVVCFITVATAYVFGRKKKVF